VDVVGEVAELDPQVGVALVELEILAEAGLDCLWVNKKKLVLAKTVDRY
jgi:hypothetical protein